MGYWRSKVLPKIKKVFEKSTVKKTAAAEACKSFDDSKEAINVEFEGKKIELQPKVVEIFEASSAEIKTLVKERKEVDIKNNTEAVQTFLEELVKIEFPGSIQASEASTNFGAVLVPGPILFVLEKVSTLVITEETGQEETGETSEVVAAEVVEEKEISLKVEEKEEQVKEKAIQEEKKEEEEIKGQVVEEEKTLSQEPSKPQVVAEEEKPLSQEPTKPQVVEEEKTVSQEPTKPQVVEEKTPEASKP